MSNKDNQALPTQLEYEIFGLEIEMTLYRKWLFEVESNFNEAYERIAKRLERLKKELKEKQGQLDAETAGHPSEVLGE